MSSQRYSQYCALARALDVAGNRWTLLIIRELVPGPRRFTDLMQGLPGISRALLTERLRGLEQDGVIARHELPPPAARRVYELTDDGRELAAAMGPLIGWGAKRIGDRQRGETFQPRWVAVAMAGLADRDATTGVTETYQYVIGDSSFHFTIEDGSLELHDGRADEPAVVVETDERTWQAIASGKLKASAALGAGSLRMSGDPEASKRLGRILSHDRMVGPTPDAEETRPRRAAATRTAPVSRARPPRLVEPLPGVDGEP